MNNIRILVLSTILISATGAGQTSWQWVNPLPQGNLLNGITSVNADTILAVGDYGTIIKTTNGGTTWLVTPTAGGMTESLFDIDFTSNDDGWAVGVTGQAIRTTNGGHTWQFEQLSTIRDLLSVQFHSPDIGWISGSKGSMYSTLNAGSTWHAESTGVLTNLYDVFFLDSLTGWSVGATGTIIHSTDGGETWSAQVSGTTQPLYSVIFLSSTVGYAAGAFGKVLKTLDGGDSWTPMPTNAIYSLFKIHFTSVLNGWAMGAFGSIIKTTNGGLSWFEQSSNTYNDIYAVNFVSPTLGYGVGDYGTILKTTDGGTTWDVLSTGTKNILYGVHFPNQTNGFAVGEEGTFAKSSDGGYNWNELFTGIFQTYYGVWFVDNNTGWIVGDSAVILKTTNGGATWNDQNSRSEETLNSVYFLNASRGWAVGDFGTILSTTNGGTAWTAQTVASFTSFLKIRFVNDQVGWIAGYGGEIFKTTNGGATWVEQFSGTTQAIYSLDVIDANTVYASGDFGTLLKTIDGGENWNSLTGDFFESFYGMVFSSPTTGWAVGDEGTIVLTTNGGATWSRMVSGTSQTLFDVQLVRLSAGGILFAAGEGGTIICSGVTPLPVRTWTGASDSLWTFPGNWTPSGIPGKSDSVSIPLTARNPVIRSTVQQINIGALRIATGARLTMRNGVAEFVVKGNVNVDGTLELDPVAKTNFVVGRDFVVGGNGQFIHGSSTVVFNGNGLIRGKFHNVIFRESVRVQSVGNVVIRNSLLILGDLTLRSVDTLLILNGDPAALQGTGTTGPGTIRRAIAPGNLAPYRFESPVTYIRFQPVGTPPDTVTMTATPGAVPPGQGDSVFVRRWYNVKATGGNNYMATVSFRYDTSETTIPIEDLVLFRDSANIVVNMGQTDYLDSDLVAISLDSVRNFSRWYLGWYDFLPKNQFQFVDSLFLTDNGGLKDTLLYGAYPGSTDGIDTALGEAALAVAPGVGTFDTRWLLPPTQGSPADFRDILTILHDKNTYSARLQAGPGGFPFTLRWNVANFPPGKFTLRDKATAGAQFSINMRNQNTYVVTNPAITQVEIVHDGPEFFSFNSGWNIISLPLKPTGTKLKTLIFPSAVSKAFFFNNGYQYDDTLDNGVAYWLKFSNNQDIGIDGDTVESDTIPVNAGWNMIGTVTGPVPTVSIGQQPPGNVVSSYFGFGASYTPTTALQPARGYWVKTNATGTLVLSSSAAAPRITALPPEWEALARMNGITVTDRHGSGQTLHFSRRYPEGVNPLAYELPPPPPAGVFDARFASDRVAELFGNAGSVSQPIVLRGARYPVTIVLTPGDDDAMTTIDLIDGVTDAVLALNVGPGNPFVLRDAAVTSIVVRAGTGVEVPKAFALHQNYPNPFNPTTTIAFDLASDATVSVRVFNVLGQTVARLTEDREFAAGSHRLDFRADAYGSGIYFCRMDATGVDGVTRTFSTKMLLLK